MKVVRSEKFQILGFQSKRNDFIPAGWVIKSRNFKCIKDFEPEIVVVSELKYVDGGRVYFLTRDGKIRECALAVEPFN